MNRYCFVPLLLLSGARDLQYGVMGSFPLDGRSHNSDDRNIVDDQYNYTSIHVASEMKDLKSQHNIFIRHHPQSFDDDELFFETTTMEMKMENEGKDGWGDEESALFALVGAAVFILYFLCVFGFRLISVSQDSFDAKWFRTTCNPAKIICESWSTRKVAWFLTYTSVTAAVILVEIFVHSWITSMYNLFKLSSLPMFITLFGYEPLFIIFMLWAATYPDEEDDMSEEDRKKKNRQIAFVIPCHKSSDVILKTIESVIVHAEQQQIFVMDNGNNDRPFDDTRELLEEHYPRVNYVWNPYGNKTLAQYAGCILAEKYPYIVLMDDDVTIPPKMDFKSEWIDDNVRAVSYPIKAIPEQGPDTVFIDCQALEYKICDYAKMIQSKYSTVLYPHGAISLWDRATLMRILRWHDTVFYADDVKMGVWLQLQGYEMRMAPSVLIDTDAPATVCGAMPNYWNQRVRSWDMAEHVYTWQFIKVLFATRHRTLSGTLWMKAFQFYSVYCIVVDWLRIVVITCYLIIGPMVFLQMMACLMVGSLIAIIGLTSVGYRNRPSLRPKWSTFALYPAYKFLGTATRICGMMRCIVIYMPQFRKKPKIPVLETTTFKNLTTQTKVKFSVPVWLSDDPRYQSHRDMTIAEVSETSISTEDDLSSRWSLRSRSSFSRRSFSRRSFSRRSFSRRSLGSTSDNCQGDDSSKPFSADPSISDGCDDVYPIKPSCSASSLLSATSNFQLLSEESEAFISDDCEGDDRTKRRSVSRRSVSSLLSATSNFQHISEESDAYTSDDWVDDDSIKSPSASSLLSALSNFQPLSEETAASTPDDCEGDDTIRSRPALSIDIGSLHRWQEWIWDESQDDDYSPGLSVCSGISDDDLNDSEHQIDSVGDQKSIDSMPI